MRIIGISTGTLQLKPTFLEGARRAADLSG